MKLTKCDKCGIILNIDYNELKFDTVFDTPIGMKHPYCNSFDLCWDCYQDITKIIYDFMENKNEREV